MCRGEALPVRVYRQLKCELKFVILCFPGPEAYFTGVWRQMRTKRGSSEMAKASQTGLQKRDSLGNCHDQSPILAASRTASKLSRLMDDSHGTVSNPAGPTGEVMYRLA